MLEGDPVIIVPLQISTQVSLFITVIHVSEKYLS